MTTNVKNNDSKGTGAGLEIKAFKLERAAFEQARDEAQTKHIFEELGARDAARARMIDAIKASDKETAAAKAERLYSPSRRLIDKGGEAGEDEARQCLACHRQRVEMSGAALAEAAGKLGERWGKGWLRKKSAAMGREIDFYCQQDVIAIFRTAGIFEVMAGNVSGLLGSRHAIKAARKAANAEVRRAGARDGADCSLDSLPSNQWELRLEFKAAGSVPHGNSSAPNRSAGAGLRPSVAAEIEDWGAGVRAVFAARIQAAKTPQAKVQASKSAAVKVDLVAGLLRFAAGGDGLPVEAIAAFFDGSAVNGPISAAGRKALQRLRQAVAG